MFFDLLDSWNFQVSQQPDSRFLLLVLDFSVPPNLVEIDELVHQTATILHLDARSAMLCILPQKYSGQTTKSNITANRRIEDALLKAGLNLECEIGTHFTIDSMHGNDKRPLSARAKLCFSEKICTEDGCDWMASLAARGKMPDIPLMRIREMKRLCQPGHVGEAIEAYNLSPAERCQQKGSRAVLKIVENLIADTVIASPDTRLDLVEMKVDMVPCWAEGSFLMKQQWASDSSKPKVSYVGFCREVVVTKTMETHLHAVLMQEWWESQPAAGPQEPADSGPVDKPMLTIVSWNDVLPALPDMIVSKFDGDETYSSKWNAKVSSFRDFVTNKIAPLISLPVGTPAVSGNVGSLTGPDWSVGDMVPPIQNVLLRATATADFQSDNVFLILIHFQIHDSPIHDSFQFISQELGCWAHNLPALSLFLFLCFCPRLFTVKATRTLPTLLITKDRFSKPNQKLELPRLCALKDTSSSSIWPLWDLPKR